MSIASLNPSYGLLRELDTEPARNCPLRRIYACHLFASTILLAVRNQNSRSLLSLSVG